MTPSRPAPRPPVLLGSVLALLALVASPSARAASGADRGFGYAWRDSASGATYGFVTPDSITLANPANNSAPIRVSLGMTGGFPFYGVTYNDVWISDNGWISFRDPLGNSHPGPPTAIPDGVGADPDAVIAPLWTDLDLSFNDGATFIYYGRIAATNSWLVSWNGPDTVSGQRAALDCHLYPDGRIKFQYTRVLPIGQSGIGIEADFPLVDGIQIAAGGLVEPGVALGNPYAIEFLRGIMPSQCGTVPLVACGGLNDSLPGAFPANILYYSCSATRFAARERVYQITLAAPSVLDLGLTGSPNVRAFILRSCNEYACLRGPVTSTSIALSAGSYYIVVDAPAQTDEGAYDLNLACSSIGTPVACNTTVAGVSPAGASLWDSYSCPASPLLGGAENVYAIDIVSPTNLQATLLTGPATLDVIIMQATGAGEISGASCLAWGSSQAIVWGATPGRYLIVVDSPPGAGGAFDLEIECKPGVDCTSPQGTIDFASRPVETIRGDTTGQADNAGSYPCDAAGSYPGGEDVWLVTLPTAGQVTIRDTSGSQSYFLLSACNEGACVGTNGCSTTVAAGTYYLVVDGPASGAYEAMVFFESPPFPRWTNCQDPRAGTSQSDTRRDAWQFADGWYCIGDTRSRNYPGPCLFAMYASVRCGTALHLPLYDVEGGHVRIFDVMNGQYVNLTAQSTGGWSMTGTDIFWENCSGTDGRWNNQTTDVFFNRPTGLCGIFRLEFPSHAGHEWELYSNCTGARSPGFYIYDTLCQALDEYVPLPNVVLLSASGVYACPDVTVTYTIKNDGCAPVTDFPVGFFDGTTRVATDTVPFIDAGETLTLSFVATVSMPSGALYLEADPPELPLFPNGRVTECIEVPGAGCDPLVGTEQASIAPCGSLCRITARATVTPPTICPGETVDIDARGSSSVACPGGALQYQLRGPTGNIPWQAIGLFTGLAPVADATYDVDVRCAAEITCTDTTSVTVDVFVSATDLLPKIGGTLRAGGDYGDGTRRYGDTFVEFNWGASRPLDAPAGEHYHLYRSAQPGAGFAPITTDAPILQVEAFTDSLAAQPDDRTYCWYYLGYVADWCDQENTATDGGDGG